MDKQLGGRWSCFLGHFFVSMVKTDRQDTKKYSTQKYQKITKSRGKNKLKNT